MRFEALSSMLVRRVQEAPEAPALVLGETSLSRGELDARARRVAAGLQALGVGRGDRVALPGELGLDEVVSLLGVLRAGACAVPLPSFAGDEALGRMVADAGVRVLLGPRGLPGIAPTTLDAPPAAVPAPVTLTPEDELNIIYSSGTTGEPKGILHDQRTRWFQALRMGRLGLGPGAVVLVATPLWSNTTLITLLPTLALGGTAVLMPRFDEAGFVELARRHRATHTMLVPVQYGRLLDRQGPALRTLEAFAAKLCTGAPLPEARKRALLQCWPGNLLEIYGQTEGGPTTVLDAARFPDRLGSVGRAAQGVDLRIIDGQGRELPAGQAGEVVGRAPSMMTGYVNRPEATAALTWRDGAGRAYYRTGDVGRIDEDGFLHLLGREKDVIISGGLNIHAADLEAVLLRHEAVAEAAVFGVSDARWGERPYAVVVPRRGVTVDAGGLVHWANRQLAPVQRLSGAALAPHLPRGPTGKLLRRELRRRYGGAP